MIRVRLFAALREAAGAPTLEVEDAKDVGTLLDRLGRRYGERFSDIASAGTVVLEGETVGRERPLHPGDEVALLPPVSGG